MMVMEHTSIPLFVFGVARSGTSYVHHLLAAHPQVRLSYESRLIRDGQYYYNKWPRLEERGQFYRFLDKVVQCEAGERQNEWLVQTIQSHRADLFEAHRQHGSFAGFVKSIYMRPNAVKCWGNKMLRVEACTTVRKLWTNARCLILMRDPRAVYASQVKKFGTRIKYSTIYWNTHAQWTKRHAGDVSSFIVIRYEDLVSRPFEQLQAVFAAAGIADEAVTRAILGHQPARQGSTEAWRRSLTPEQVRTIESHCFDQMREWGYEPELAKKQLPMSPLFKGVETFMEYRHRVRLDADWWRRKQIISRFVRSVLGKT